MAYIDCGTFLGNVTGASTHQFRVEVVLQAEDIGTGYKIYRIARFYVLTGTTKFTSNMRMSWSSEVTTPVSAGTKGNYYGISPAKLIGTYNYGSTVTLSEECHYYLTEDASREYRSTVNVSYTIPYPTYAVIYDANGGVGAPETQTKTYGQNITLSSIIPTRNNYRFKGWSANVLATDPQYNSGDTYTANAPITLYAVWRVGSYTVTYDPNGGMDAPSPQIKQHNETITLSQKVPYRSKYEFVGWGITPTAATVQPGSTYSTNEDLTLYAVWRKVVFTVTYDGNGATSGAMVVSDKPQSAASINLRSNSFIKTGFAFQGWNTEANGSGTFYADGAVYSDNADITLYAQWAYRGAAIDITAHRTLTGNSKRKNPGGRYVYVHVKYTYAVQPPNSARTIYYTDGSVDENEVIEQKVKQLGSSALQNGEYEFWLEDLYDPEQKFSFEFRYYDASTSTYSNTVGITINADNDYFFRFYGLEKILKMRRSIELDKLFFDRLFGKILSRSNDGDDVEILLPQDENGNTRIGYGNYERMEGTTGVYGNHVEVGVNVDGVETVYKPYHYPGETLLYGWLSTMGFITSSGNDLRFFIPLSKPMVGVTSASVSGSLYIRQNGKYLYGSSANNGVPLDSYEVTITAGGLTVNAHYYDTENVTNNDTCGIQFTPVIIFE